MRNIHFILIFLFAEFCFSQTIKGIVRDLNTNQPIESASIYFDQTTIGTSTDNEGKFEIVKNENVNTPLVISFLGYEKVRIEQYDSASYYKIYLEEAENELDQVVISVDEGMSRERKLAEFKREFLGATKNGESCEILNEDDLILRFNKKTKTLIADAYQSLRIKNEKLGYSITYDIGEFQIDYAYVNIESETYNVRNVYYEGTSFYESILDVDKKTNKKRDEVYKGSILHFMRALKDEKLGDRGYQVFSRGFIVQPDKYIQVRPSIDSSLVDVRLRLPLSVLYDNEYQTDLKPKFINTSRISTRKPLFKIGDTINLAKIRALKITDTISIKSRSAQNSYYNTFIRIDNFGNFGPPSAFSFSGYMGTLRIGDTLPLDYKLNQTNTE
ncbi:MAG: carboxypeptidase-like regulatory domain-containing protein [Bacteroidota bacterium]